MLIIIIIIIWQKISEWESFNPSHLQDRNQLIYFQSE